MASGRTVCTRCGRRRSRFRERADRGAAQYGRPRHRDPHGSCDPRRARPAGAGNPSVDRCATGGIRRDPVLGQGRRRVPIAADRSRRGRHSVSGSDAGPAAARSAGRTPGPIRRDAAPGRDIARVHRVRWWNESRPAAPGARTRRRRTREPRRESSAADPADNGRLRRRARATRSRRRAPSACARARGRA